MDILDLHQKSIDCVMLAFRRHFGTLPNGEWGGGELKSSRNQQRKKTVLYSVLFLVVLKTYNVRSNCSLQENLFNV